MRQLKSIFILLLLSLILPLTALADSFKVMPDTLELGKTATLKFILENTEQYYGFQADVLLPAGLEAVKGADGQYITLSSRAGGKYQVNSNINGGRLIIGAFDAQNPHTPFTGNSGVLAEMTVNVSDSFEEGAIVVEHIYFIDKDDNDVPFGDASTTLGVAVTKIELSAETSELKVGESVTLTAAVTPTNASDKSLKWKSSDPDVATVDALGKVTAKAIGEATITATCKCGKVSGEFKVTVIATPVTGLEVQDEDKQPLTSGVEIPIETGSSYDLTAVVTPTDATDKTVTWTSSDETVATVDAQGLIKTYKAGTATITASIAGFKFEAKVVVTDPVIAVESVTLNKTEAAMKTGESLTLTATISPADATSTVSWSSSDKDIATVTRGVVSALKAGTVTITASAGGKNATCTITITDIEVTSVALDQTEATLTEGETLTLKATVNPENATDKTVTWTSSDEHIAAVSDQGVVTTYEPGTVTITATAGKVSASCTITVKAKVVAVESITLDKTTATVTEGLTVQLKATVNPTNATDRTVTWTSSDEAVATVDAKGLVKGVKAGKATITATASNGKTATCEVTVEAATIDVTGVTLDKTTLSLTEGETATLKATVAPTDATDKTVTWTSSKTAVATVDADGKVTAVAAGEAVITAKAGEKTATCTVTVAAKAIEVTGITLDKTTLSLTEGETATLKATVAPTDATDKTVTWTSSKTAVATVDADGKVTAVAPGEAVITAKAGEKTATCTVTVAAKQPEPVEPEVPEGDPVKMTYVNMDEPTKAYGEIAAGETAIAGFNKISGGTVGFGNTTWGVDYITYIQVDASAVKGTITSATLSFEASGSTDSKRVTTWGVGYNSSEWSSTMTYESADKSITTLGDTKTTATKSASTFEWFSFDVTEALKNSEGKVATILVYETAAAGGYVKNPIVKIEATTESVYNVTFKETNGVEGVTVKVNGLDATSGIELPNGTYSFTATAPKYLDYTGEFKVEGADKEVTFAMTPKATWSYTVKNNVNDKVVTGTCLEGESASVSYSRYILDAEGTVWMKDAISKEYKYTFTPDEDGYVATLEYAATDMTDGIWFAEAEDIEGLTATTSGQIAARGSNAAGAYAAEAVTVYTLKPGTYKVEAAVAGNAGATILINAGQETVITGETTGSWTKYSSEEITIEEPTELTVQGGSSEKPLDYILITGTEKEEPTVIEVAEITLDQTEVKILIGETATLVATVTPSDATDATVTWTSSDVEVATVDETGKVTAIAIGEAIITAKAGDKTAQCKVTVDRTTGVALIGFDPEAPVKVYNLNGVLVSDSMKDLPKGCYIVRQGDAAKKVIVK